mmetsp:Transcript_34097/g.89652  ORF Transcript_34097/g.89652 Transcript_34097/m.89652 type:complete len:674 (+) Transcript_34097:66-2087(+)
MPSELNRCLPVSLRSCWRHAQPARDVSAAHCSIVAVKRHHHAKSAVPPCCHHAAADASLRVCACAHARECADSAMHYAAMAGTIPVIDLLASRGLAVDDAATIVGSTPLQVALEYKRLPAARRLQQLRDQTKEHASNASTAPPPLPPEPTAPMPLPVAPSATVVAPALAATLPSTPDVTRSSSRPAPRFPNWILASAAEGGLDIAELDGDDDEATRRACELVARSAPFVWRRSSLGPRLVKPLQQVQALRAETLDTNVARGSDRKFAYFSPERLERGIFDPAAVRKDFGPMHLNEQLRVEESLRRQRRLATTDAARDGGTIAGAAGCSGWRVGPELAADEGCPYVMHKLLEAATSAEAALLAQRGEQLPPQKRPGIGRLAGLDGDQYALWSPGLAPLAQPVASQTEWARLGRLVHAGGWSLFEQAGVMISGRDALTPTHYDGHHNVFLQLAGAKRFLLFAADQGGSLYPFPALHPLDPLSRVDLELPDEEIASRFPRARRSLRGAVVVLEAGDVLVMPQGVWHQVHSLEMHNLSLNLLFGLDRRERFGKPTGLRAPLAVGSLPPHRRPPALATLAKSLESLAAQMVGPARAPQVLASLADGARGGDGSGGGDTAKVAAVLRQLLLQCLASAPPASDTKAVKKSEGDGVALPSVEMFASCWFDARRFEGLPLRK